MDYSYGSLTGKDSARGAPPVIATAPAAAADNTNSDPGREADGWGAMFHPGSSPAFWYAAAVIVTAALAKSLGVVRAG